MQSTEFNRIIEHLTLGLNLLREDMPKDALEHFRVAQQLINEIMEVPGDVLASLAGGLIDSGSELHDAGIVGEGLAILESRFDKLSIDTPKSDIEYWIGNAKKSLYDMAISQKGYVFHPESIALLTEAKNCYWRSYQSQSFPQKRPHLLVNLAGTLDQCGRNVESFYWYNQALTQDPTYGMAHLNRGISLFSLSKISLTSTIKLWVEAKHSFDQALSSGQLQKPEQVTAHKYQTDVAKKLQKSGWDEAKQAHYDAIDKEQSQQHAPYRQFCLDHNLALCEHALYCRCVGARRDDLTIPFVSIGGDFVPRLEMILNRMKSEFCLARALYYQATIDQSPGDTHLYEGTFTELNENEIIGIRSEFLRTSFRLCFGVLDKIAHGLNELYRFASPKEQLYFERFWHPNTEEGEKRWLQINQERNTALVGLYSIATDLSEQKGPWGFFKSYRNILEHGLLVLLDKGATDLPKLVIPQHIEAITMVPYETFTSQTLLMLQLTASAIFNFVFCARIEGKRQLKGARVEIPVTLNRKHIGKE